MSSSARSAQSAKEKKEKEKKDRKEKEKTSSSEADSNPGEGVSTGGSSGVSNPQRNDTNNISDMQHFCQILQAGFDSVTNKLGEKLDAVGTKFGQSLNDLHASLDDRMTELASRDNVSEAEDLRSEFDHDSCNNGEFDRRHGPDHNLSDTSSVPDIGAGPSDSYFKQRNQNHRRNLVIRSTLT